MPPARDWRLHLGAHKTATTHIQARCAALELPSRGVGYMGNDELTPMRLPDLRARALPLKLSPWLRRREMLRRLDGLGRLHDRMVLSNEDWIGHGEAALEPTPYPEAGRRIGSLVRGLARDGRVTLFLSVRCPDGFLPSVYAQVMRYRPYPGGFEPIRRRAVDRPPDWAGLVERIMAAAGPVPLRVWPYESYRGASLAVLREITGLALDAAPEIPDPPTTRTPSAQAVRAAEGLAHVTAYGERIPRVAALYDEVEGEKFMPFTEPERALLREAYEAQLDALRRRRPEVWWDPAEGAA